MHRAVLEVLQQQPTRWQSIPAFNRAVTALQQSIAEREAIGTIQAKATKGITEATENAYRKAIDATLLVAQSAAAYALEQNDPELYSRTNMARSYLTRLPVNTLLSALEQMAKAITDPQPVLEKEYGLTRNDVKAMNDAIGAARAALPATRTEISARVAATGSVKAAEDRARNAVERIDRLILRLRQTAPGWVDTYQAARRVVDAGQ
ncbi:MAG: hypothetical protein EOP52_12680 [Sphingobacteriales bacterium]|nr:MAG: hypothetical protein EOP52_12680 [Sphingobacteriales bacterium]